MADLVITNKQYIYLKIPTKYICIYHQLCELMVDFGEDMLKDCKADCASRNVEVQKCFNMFNAALLARELGKTKHEETLIKYIKAKLKSIDCKSCKETFTIQLEQGLTGYVDCNKGNPIIRIDPDEPLHKNNSIYVVVKPNSYLGYNDYQEYARQQIINENIIVKETLDISSGTSDYNCDLTDSKLIFAVLIPIEKACDVKVDDGFGGKVQFGSSNTWYSNGNVSIELDGIEYQVFGELYPIAGNVKFYVTVV